MRWTARLFPAGMMAATLVILCGAVLGAAPKKPADLRTIVRVAISDAGANFAHLRTARSATNGYDYVTYALTPAFKTVCRDCNIIDEFATPSYHEYWVATFDWYYGKNTTPDQVVADALSQLKPVLAGYKVSRSTKDGRIALDWEGPQHTWLYLRTNDTKYDDPGFHMRIGHDLAKSLHVVKAPPLTNGQKAAVTAALTSFIKLGAGDAANDFSSIRGSKRSGFKPNDFEPYNCAVSFLPALTGCEVTGLLNYDAAKWILETKSVPVGGTPEQAAALVYGIVENAMPSGWNPPATPDVLSASLLQDYHSWDGPSRAQFSYNSNYADGKTTFTFDIWHFL
jgi:hypothetical protein